jgi:hypothetical protein
MASYSIRINYTHHPYPSILPLLSSNLRALTLDLPIKAAASRDITMDLTSLSLYGLQLNKLVIYMRLYLWALTAQECIDRYTPFLENAKTEVSQLVTAWVGGKSEMLFREKVESRLPPRREGNIAPWKGTMLLYKIGFEVVRVGELR